MIMKKDENVFSTFLDVKMHEKTVKENDWALHGSAWGVHSAVLMW